MQISEISQNALKIWPWDYKNITFIIFLTFIYMGFILTIYVNQAFFMQKIQ